MRFGILSEGANSGFLTNSGKGIELKDLLLLFLVPLVLVVVFVLPEGFQEGMVLNFQDPDFLNFFTTALVHSNFDHLSSNLVSYLVTIIPLYWLCVLSGLKKQFRRLFLVFVLFFPFLLSGLNFALLDLHTSRGFSGVNSAFLGFLGVASFHYLKQILEVQSRQTKSKILKIFDGSISSKSILLFLYASGVMALFYTKPFILFFTILTLIIVYLSTIIYRTDWQPLKKFVKRTGYLELFIFSISIYLITVPALFPRKIEGTNILSHYLGLSLGILTTTIWVSRS